MAPRRRRNGGSATSTHPKVAAILATLIGPRSVAARGTRVDDVMACVRAMLANTYAPLEVVVVDQSPTDALAVALLPIRESERRLRYFHISRPGKSRAQNLAINSSDAAVFCFTDDDCLVPLDWVSSIVATFRRRPDAGVLFGDVHAPAGHNWATDFVPELRHRREERLPNAFLPKVNNLMGANMAISRDTFRQIGLFDEALGPGGSSGAYNEEVEFHLRALRADPSIRVYLSPAFPVVHQFGSRPQGEAARRLLQTYERGKSAMLTKYAAAGDVGAACALFVHALEPFVDGARNAIRTGRPRGLGMIVPYLDGVRRGLHAARASQRIPLRDAL